MPSFGKIITSLASVATLATALPAKTVMPADSTPFCPEVNKTVRIYASALYTLFPNSPDLVTPPVTDFHVQYHNETRLNIKQAAAFGKFPKEATGCAFGWAQDDADKGVLVAGGDGLLTARQLSGFPENATAGVSAAAVGPFDTAGSEWEFHTEFTGWDREVKGTYHSSGPGKINCTDNIYIILEKASTTNGNIFLKRSENAGLFIEYRFTILDHFNAVLHQPKLIADLHHHHNCHIISSDIIHMCQLRRVYYGCGHEDLDVTPPRALIYCNAAQPRKRGSIGGLKGFMKPCALVGDLSLTEDRGLAIQRPGLCEACAAEANSSDNWLDSRDGIFGSNYQLVRPPTPPAKPPRHRGSTLTSDRVSQDSANQLQRDAVKFPWNWTEEDPPELWVTATEPKRGSEDSSESINGVDHSHTITNDPPVTIQWDFQLYESGDEFGDLELKDISNKDRNGSSA
ncbi:uncharacterized protein F4822DRAFT_432612 [Hypoxylon trugodes]|uniref:uncharacterized protein n=1 Tax=Hypoxylon trugodes TaxID=326681 RepID=UPI00219BADE2|nr:uncharacterized protein F4822DRAFT_432612 [Hypoxylon trugodes]KAI1385760.1 hypothetical protein F4822DRAFT_432612 [Hypoxylon trugodes]